MIQPGPHVLPAAHVRHEVIPVTADRIQADLLRNQRLGAGHRWFWVPKPQGSPQESLLVD